MELNDLLRQQDIDPANVLILRHRPWESELRKVLPWIANERSDLFNAYQATQNPRVEKSMSRSKFIASFLGQEPGKALFVGLYEQCGSRPLTRKEYWKLPEYLELVEYGMGGFSDSDERKTIDYFDLQLMSFHQEWKGKLIVKWPGLERSWYRWADRNVMPIHAILEDSILDSEMPEWNRLNLSWQELRLLPRKWRETLSHWRGIYFILDVTDGQGYVGSAYGKDNLMGRWLNYATTGHGGNKQLRKRQAENLRFSILQRVSPDMEADKVIDLESSWKERLHTREFGMNDN